VGPRGGLDVLESQKSLLTEFEAGVVQSVSYRSDHTEHRLNEMPWRVLGSGKKANGRMKNVSGVRGRSWNM
jgi:hypothetical protein